MEKPIGECKFSFDKKAFKDYYELHLRPHDRNTGWKRVWLFICLFLIWSFAPCFLFLVEQHKGKSVLDSVNAVADGTIKASGEFPLYGILSLIGLVFIAIIVGFIHSIILIKGRKPRWNTKRWQARQNLAFRYLGSGDTKSPLEPSIETTYSIFYNATAIVSIGDSWYDEGIFFDFIPWIFPRFDKELFNPEKNTIPDHVTFAAKFYPDHIEKGLHETVFAQSYTDVFDVVEDRRYPDYAILRHKDKESQLVIRKSALSNITWEEIKDRIKEASDTVTLREALFGKKKQRR